jgi:hypothetical protein
MAEAVVRTELEASAAEVVLTRWVEPGVYVVRVTCADGRELVGFVAETGE